MLLEEDDLGPQAIAFVSELTDALTQPVVVGDRRGDVGGGIYEAGVAFTLSGAVRAHPLCVRRPLPRSANSAGSSHRIEMVSV